MILFPVGLSIPKQVCVGLQLISQMCIYFSLVSNGSYVVRADSSPKQSFIDGLDYIQVLFQLTEKQLCLGLQNQIQTSSELI